MSYHDETLSCLNEDPSDPCAGKVEYHSTDIGRRRAFPRCERHWRKRLALEDEVVRKYNPDGHCPPQGFDPADAGERWEDDY